MPAAIPKIIHPEFMGLTEKVIGMIKDEDGGKIIKEFVGLRAKLYSDKLHEGKAEKKCKGVKKSVVKNNIMMTTKPLTQGKATNEEDECHQILQA